MKAPNKKQKKENMDFKNFRIPQTLEEALELNIRLNRELNETERLVFVKGIEKVLNKKTKPLLYSDVAKKIIINGKPIKMKKLIHFMTKEGYLEGSGEYSTLPKDEYIGLGYFTLSRTIRYPRQDMQVISSEPRITAIGQYVIINHYINKEKPFTTCKN